MAIVYVSAFFALVDFDEYFFIEPGLNGHSGVGTVVAIEGDPLLLVFVGGVFLVVLHDEGDDFERLIFHSLNVEVYFCADLVF